ncbi:MAG: hypothetical protein V4655_05670 [Bdellovibrionota bacterium]
MRLSFAFLSAGLLASLLNTSCGKWAKASPEAVQTMQRPTYPSVSNDVFSLNSPKSYISYKGTMVIFDKTATPIDTAELIDASVDSRMRWAESKKFQDDTNYNAVYGDANATAINQLKLMKDGLQKFDLDALSKTPINPEARLANAQTLVSRELDLLQLPAEQRATFDADWGHYCEAKIIEFAAHPLLAQNAFKSKPSPAPLCEAYYAANAFMTSPDCTAENGDYLRCIWLDGVSKTRWFTSPQEPTDAEVARVKTEKRAKLVGLFSESNYQATKSVLALSTTAFVDTAIGKTYLNNKEKIINIAVRQTKDTVCVRAIVNVGSQDYCSLFSLSPEKISPKQVIDAMEAVVPLATAVTDLPTPAGRSYSLQQLLQYVNKRPGIENSESDRLFLDLSGVTLNSPTFSKFGESFANLVPEIRSGLGAEFYGTFSPEDRIARVAKVSAIQNQEAQMDFVNTEYRRYLEAAGAGSERGAASANRPGFAKGFVQYEMIYQQVNNILSAELAFEDQDLYAFRACLDLNTKQNIPCPQGFQLRSELTYLPATLNWAEDGGKIELSLPLTQVEAIGFGPVARKSADETPSFFMDLPASETEGKTLRFELYRNRLLDALDIMTGKAFIEDASAQYYEAGISMWENVD